MWKARYNRESKSWRIWVEGTANCESRDVGPHGHDLATGRTYHGWLQFSLRTWNNAQRYVPPSWRFYDDPHTRTKYQQGVVGIRLARNEGKQHWPICGRR